MPAGRQDAGHPGFVAADRPYDCNACIAFHGEKFSFPPLPDEAQEAWALYMLLQDQQRVGMDVIGLDYTVLPVAFDVYEIPAPRRRRVFEQLVTLNHEFTRHRVKQSELKAQQAEAMKRGGMVVR